MAGVDYEIMLQIAAFMAIIWIFERMFELFHLSRIIGAICAGILCGPPVLDFVPFSSPEQDDISPFVLAGTVGVTFLLMESGTHCQWHKVKKVLKNACIVGCLGTFIPLGTGIGMMYAFGFDIYPDCISTGAALSATSVGIAIKLLTENKQLNSLPGQTIVNAAVVDDILCLIILVILVDLGKGEVSPVDIVIKFVSCVGFVGIAGFLAVKVWPVAIPKYILNKLPSNREHSIRDMVHFTLMLGFLVFYGWIGSIIGSHLIGAFAAGMTFATIKRSHYVWNRQIKRYNAWLVRFFFAATVGFMIPIKEMFEFKSFWMGSLLALVSCVLAKVMAGMHVKKWRWVIGFAMVGRGEFAYLVAEIARSQCDNSYDPDKKHKSPEAHPIRHLLRRLLSNPHSVPCSHGHYMLSSEAYAIVVWALLIAIIVAPIAFEYVLKRAFAGKGRSGIQHFVITAQGPYHIGMNFEIMDVLHNMHLDVLEAKMENDGETAWGEYVVNVTDEADELNPEKMEEIKHAIQDAINDTETMILLKYDLIDEEPMDGEINLPMTPIGRSDYTVGQSPFTRGTTGASPRLSKRGERLGDTGHDAVDVDLGSPRLSAAGAGSATKGPSVRSPEPKAVGSLRKGPKTPASVRKQQAESRLSDLPHQKYLKNMNETWLEIRIMAEHDTTIVTEVLETLDSLNLHVMKGHTEEHQSHEEEIFFAKCSEKGSISRDKCRSSLRHLFKKHGMHCQIMVKVAKASDVFVSERNLPRSQTNMQAHNSQALLDKVEEGFEISLEIDHAERDSHVVSRISRELTNHGLDVTSFDIDEGRDSKHHLSLYLFVRAPHPTETKRLEIKKIIIDYLESHNLEPQTVSIKIIDAIADETYREFESQMSLLNPEAEHTKELQRQITAREDELRKLKEEELDAPISPLLLGKKGEKDSLLKN